MGKRYHGVYVGSCYEESWYEKGVDEEQYAEDVETRVIEGRLLTFKQSNGRLVCLGLNDIVRMVWESESAFEVEITTSDGSVFNTEIYKERFFYSYVLSPTVLVGPVKDSFPIRGVVDNYPQ